MNDCYKHLTGLKLQASLVTYLTKHLSTTWSFQVVAQKGLTLSTAGSVSLYAAKVDLNPFSLFANVSAASDFTHAAKRPSTDRICVLMYISIIGTH